MSTKVAYDENLQLFDPVKHTMYPSVTGTSVLAIKYNAGVIIASDNLLHYGSLAKYCGFPRMFSVNKNAVMACTGDVADYQFVKDIVESMDNDDELLDDQFRLSANGIHSWVTRVLYNRRSKFNPLFNVYITGGLSSEGTPFLGYTNMLGIAFKDDCLSTGFGAHLAVPILRKCLEECNGYENLSLENAQTAIIQAIRVLYYRDCRAFNRYEIAVINKDGIDMKKDVKLETNWDVAEYVHGYE